MSATFKIVLKKDFSDPEIRRLTLKNGEVHLEGLRSRVSKLFQLRDDQVWYFKYQDEEGDFVTITEDYEFQDVLVSKTTDSAVLRLHLHVEPQPVVIQVEDCPRWSKRQHHQRKHQSGDEDVSAQNYGAICDATNKQLTIEAGNWYHLPGTNTDLCTEEYERLGEGELRRNMVKINNPSDLGDEQARYQLAGGRCHRFGGGGRRGKCPFFSKRANHGADVYAGTCDVTNEALFPGGSWFHKMNSNYDLIESEFNKLPESEKKLYVRVDKPEDLGNDIHRYLLRRRWTSGCASSCAQQVVASDDNTAAVASPSSAEGDIKQETPIPPKPQKSMKVISGPSIPEGSKVQAGARLIPIWEVENTGNGEETIWTDVRVKPKSGNNTFNVPEHGFEVPLLTPGSRGIVSVELVAPLLDESTDLKTAFELVDGEGSAFGEPLTLSLFVEAKAKQQFKPALHPVANEQELVGLLRDMGFADVNLCTQVLRENKGDVNAAALSLLRFREM